MDSIQHKRCIVTEKSIVVGINMIRQSAWCLLLMGETPPLSDKAVTHGICKACEKKLMEETAAVHKKMGVK
mgnify:CR=1 FL=1